MIITLNNEKKTVKDGSTLMELLLSEKIIADAGNLAGIAAAVNESIISKKSWTEHVLREGDSVDVFSMVSGG